MGEAHHHKRNVRIVFMDLHHSAVVSTISQMLHSRSFTTRLRTIRILPGNHLQRISRSIWHASIHSPFYLYGVYAGKQNFHPWIRTQNQNRKPTWKPKKTHLQFILYESKSSNRCIYGDVYANVYRGFCNVHFVFDQKWLIPN